MSNGKLKQIVRNSLPGLSILTYLLTLCGLLLAAALQLDSFSEKVLSYYPRYKLANQAIRVLDDKPNPMTLKGVEVKGENDKPVLGSVIMIDHPSWPVLMKFLKSDTAIRKSERNEPIDNLPDAEPNSQTNDLGEINTKINFDRIKSLVVVRIDVAKIGNKPLAAPFRAAAFDPTAKKYRRLYEFVSFEEFRLDLKEMLVNELEFFAYLLSIVSVLGSISLHIIKKFKRADKSQNPNY